MEGRNPRGGHGSRYGIGANAGGPTFGQGGPGYSPHSLPPNFICERCKEPGHYIRDCPRNGDPLYNPSQHKGIPQNQQWRLLVTSDQFTKHRDRVLKSLMKQKEIYDFSERIAPKDSQQSNNASSEQAEAAAKSQAEAEGAESGANNENNSTLKLAGTNMADLPPSLKC